ncbi:MAG: glycosyltransferase family 8 protein [Clostridia bacterium]|nr:glycosyltransferase family 8 protein [Clostridia bacterium]
MKNTKTVGVNPESNLLEIVSRSYANSAAEVMQQNSVFNTKRKQRMKNTRNTKARKTVPVFFASDDNYVPFLTVAIHSMKKNASKSFDYKVYVLHSGLNGKDAETLMDLSEDWFEVKFVDVSEHIKRVAHFLHLRDYYTDAIYYRLFIVGMFPEYDKALYLDSDLVVLGDVAELYSTELGNNFIGAISDQAVAAVPAFRDYTKNALGIEAEKYFNSGVILMNLKKFREENFYEKFYSVLSSYSFIVAPDQDCLNLLCKGKVKYFSSDWNKMPILGVCGNTPKIVHYNLAQKPWHYEGVAYEEIFWEYAKETAFFERILENRAAFTPEMAKRDEEGGAKLIALAQSEAENENNYIRTLGKNN